MGATTRVAMTALTNETIYVAAGESFADASKLNFRSEYRSKYGNR